MTKKKQDLGSTLGKLALQGAGSYFLGGPLGAQVGSAFGDHFFGGQPPAPGQAPVDPNAALNAKIAGMGMTPTVGAANGMTHMQPQGYAFGALTAGGLAPHLLGGPPPTDPFAAAGQAAAGGADPQAIAGQAAGAGLSKAGVPGGELIGKAIGGGEVTGGDVAKLGLQAAGTAFGGPLGGAVASGLGSALGLADGSDGAYHKAKGPLKASASRRLDRSKGVTYPKQPSAWDYIKAKLGG